jgi:FMN phosphatase YigB (HAD superfamily)
MARRSQWVLVMETWNLTIRAVLFDLDGTLLPLDFDRFLPRYVARLAAWYGRELGIDVVGSSMAAAEAMTNNDGARTNAEVCWSVLEAATGRPRAEIERVYEAFVAREGAALGADVAADPVAPAVVEACRRAGRRVALATNPIFPRVMVDARARWTGLDTAAFDLVTCSARARFCKPNPAYYREVAARLGVNPSECLMVGNDVAMDLEPAAHAGMRTFLVDNAFVVRGERGFVPDHVGPLAGVPALLETYQNETVPGEPSSTRTVGQKGVPSVTFEIAGSVGV